MNRGVDPKSRERLSREQLLALGNSFLQSTADRVHKAEKPKSAKPPQSESVVEVPPTTREVTPPAPADTPTQQPPAAKEPEVLQRLTSIYPIKISRIRRFEEQPRTHFDEDAIEMLADSIQIDGQQQPIQVCKDPHGDDFVLIDGERRWRALHKIWKRTGIEPTALAMLLVVKSVREHFERSVSANMYREDMSPLDKVHSIARMRREGSTIADLARKVGKSLSYVQNYLLVDELPSDVKALMDPSRPKDEQLSITAATAIAMATKDEEIRRQIAIAVARNGLSLADTRSLIDRRLNAPSKTGRTRAPVDDYRMLKTFMNLVLQRMPRIMRLSVSSAYYNRDDAMRDLRRDSVELGRIINDLRRLKEKYDVILEKGFD